MILPQGGIGRELESHLASKPHLLLFGFLAPGEKLHKSVKTGLTGEKTLFNNHASITVAIKDADVDDISWPRAAKQTKKTKKKQKTRENKIENSISW